MDQIVQIFKALGDETRLKILIILSKKRICAKGLAKHLGISEATVSQHIKVLKDTGLIVGEKMGYYVHYDITNSLLQDTAEFIENISGDPSTCCCELKLQLPHDCKIACKTSQKKCCYKKV